MKLRTCNCNLAKYDPIPSFGLKIMRSQKIFMVTGKLRRKIAKSVTFSVRSSMWVGVLLKETLDLHIASYQT